MIKSILSLCFLLSGINAASAADVSLKPAPRAAAISPARLADAIYRAEGGAKTKWPYGILKRYKKTTPRQACLNTIASAQRRFAKQTKEKDFIVFLQKTYAPLNAKNDPAGLNKNWIKNVKFYYYQKKGKAK